MKGYKTALIGFGKIGAILSKDPVHDKSYPYSTHAKVLQHHPNFEWVSVVDLSEENRAYAKLIWGIEDTAQCGEQLINKNEIEIAIVATPPSYRLQAIT